jgi:hypothetical protein
LKIFLPILVKWNLKYVAYIDSSFLHRLQIISLAKCCKGPTTLEQRQYLGRSSSTRRASGNTGLNRNQTLCHPYGALVSIRYRVRYKHAAPMGLVGAVVVGVGSLLTAIVRRAVAGSLGF